MEQCLDKLFIRDIYLFPSFTSCFFLMQKKKDFPWGYFYLEEMTKSGQNLNQKISEISLRYVGAFNSDH